MSSTAKTIWKWIGIIAGIAIIIWLYKKVTAPKSPSVSAPATIQFGEMTWILSGTEPLTTIKPVANKPCAQNAGTCKNGGTLFLTSSDSEGCHYGCYTKQGA